MSNGLCCGAVTRPPQPGSNVTFPDKGHAYGFLFGCPANDEMSTAVNGSRPTSFQILFGHKGGKKQL